MHTYVPPRWTVTSSPLLAAASTSVNAGHVGSANATCATIPRPKKVPTLPRVRSMNWSGSTRWPGAMSCLRLPTALTAISRRTPSVFMP